MLQIFLQYMNFGSRGWDRTNDQRINSPLHYRCATLELIFKTILKHTSGRVNRFNQAVIYPLLLSAQTNMFQYGAPGGTRTLTRRLASKTSVSTNSTTGAIFNCL